MTNRMRMTLTLTLNPEDLMTICINKKYRTRDGKAVTIYRTAAKGQYAVHGSIADLYGETVTSWTSDGRFYDNYDADDNDLVEVVPHIYFTIWLNIYENGVAMSFATLEAADQAASQVYGRLACIPVTVDCDKGEGIDDED
jgi:hypothetical protein